MTELQWIAWIIAIGNFIGGVCITVYYKKNDRLNSALTEFAKLVTTIEDNALAYWVQASTDIYDYQLTLELRRLSRLANRIKKIDNTFTPPEEAYIAFKQAITFFDDYKRPIDPRNPLAQKIMITSANLQSYYDQYL